jgi:hypothetical protein
MTCRISIRVLPVIAVAILAGAAALPSFAEVREEFHETYPLAAAGSFGLTNINGGVRIIGWDRNEVKIDAVKTAVNKEELDELKIEVKAEPDRVFVDTKYPGDRGRSGKGHSGNASVDYTVSIPKSASIDKVKLVNGKLAVDGVDGVLKGGHGGAKSGTGKIGKSGKSGENRGQTERIRRLQEKEKAVWAESLFCFRGRPPFRGARDRCSVRSRSVTKSGAPSGRPVCVLMHSALFTSSASACPRN